MDRENKNSSLCENPAPGDGSSCENYVYIVRCSDESLYTGWTNDLEKRIAAHNAGRGAKYTRSRRPVQLVYKEKLSTKREALKREAAIKRLSAEEKRKLIAAADSRNEKLSKKGTGCQKEGQAENR